MNEKTPTHCHLSQVGPSAGTFRLDDGTSLGSSFVGYIKKVKPRYRYLLPITISTSSHDMVVWSEEPDPRDDANLQVRLNQLSREDAAAVVASRSEYHSVHLELSPDGRMITLSVPPTSGASLWAWLREDRLAENPVWVSPSKRADAKTLYGISFGSVKDPTGDAELRVLAALTTSLQAQQHLLKALKMLVKGQKRVLLQARSNFASRRGTTEPEVRSSIEQLIKRLSHPAS